MALQITVTTQGADVAVKDLQAVTKAASDAEQALKKLNTASGLPTDASAVAAEYNDQIKQLAAQVNSTQNAYKDYLNQTKAVTSGQADLNKQTNNSNKGFIDLTKSIQDGTKANIQHTASVYGIYKYYKLWAESGLEVAASYAAISFGGYLVYKGIQKLWEIFGPATERVKQFNQQLTELSGFGRNVDKTINTDAFDRLAHSATLLGTSFYNLKDAAASMYSVRYEMGLTAAGVQKLVDVFQLAGRVQGSTPENIKKAMDAISQGMAQGYLDADQWKDVFTSMPGLAKLLRTELEKNGQSMHDLIEYMKLTPGVMATALGSVYDQLNEKSKEVPQTLKEAEASMNNQKELLMAQIGRWAEINVIAQSYDNLMTHIYATVRAMTGGLSEFETKQAQLNLNTQLQQSFQDFSNWAKAGGLTNVAARMQGIADKIGGGVAELKKELSGTTPSDQLEIWGAQVQKFAGELIKYHDKIIPKDAIKEFGEQIDTLQTSLNSLNIPDDARKGLQGLLDDLKRNQLQALQYADANKALAGSMEKMMELAKKYGSIISEMSQKYGVPEALIYTVLKLEGSGPSQVSAAGAAGLMQLMPGTAKQFGVTNVFDPRQNIQGGVAYLASLQKLFGAGDITRILAGYNAGAGRVQAAERTGGIPDILETQKYVKDGLEIYKAYSQYGNQAIATDRDFKASLSPLYAAQKAYADSVEQLNLARQKGIISQEDYNRLIEAAKETMIKATQPNAVTIKQLEDQVATYEKYNKKLLESNTTVTENTNALNANLEMKKALDSLDKTSPTYANDYKRVEELSKKLVTLKTLQSDLADAMKLGIQFDPMLKAGQAQADYNEHVRLAKVLLDAGKISLASYNQELAYEQMALNKVKNPNAEYIQSLRDQIVIYTMAKRTGMGANELEQYLNVQQELTKLNKFDPNYKRQVEEVKELIPNITKMKQEFEATSKETEIFKTVANDVFKAWSDSFEAIFDKGFKGFSDLKDKVISIFKKMIADIATLGITKSIIAPVFESVGGMLGVSGSTMESVLKNFGVSGTTGGLSSGFAGLFSGATDLFSQIKSWFTGTGGAGTEPGMMQAAAGAGAQWVPYASENNLAANAMQSLSMKGTGGAGYYGLAGLAGYGISALAGAGSSGAMGAGMGAMGGAMLGASMGSIFPGIGTLVGGIVGAVAGALAGVFGMGGGKEKTRLVVRSGGEVGEYDIAQGTRMMEETEFGKFGFGGRTKNMDDWLLQQGKQIMETVKSADEQLAKLLTPEEMTKAKEAIKSWQFQGKDVDAALLERYSLIIGATNTMWKQLTLQATSVEELMKRFGYTQTISDYVTKNNLVADANKQMTTQWAQQVDNLSKNTDDLMTVLNAGLITSTKDLETVAAKVQERYNLELSMLVEVKTAMEAVKDTINTTTESIRQSTMSTADLYPYLTQKAQDLAATILNLTDPTKIQDTIGQITTLVNQAYNLMTPEQKATTGQSFIDWLTQVQGLADYQLGKIQDVLTYENQQTAAILKEAMDAATANQAAVLTQVGDAIVAAIHSLTPGAAMAFGGFVPGQWNGRSGIAGDNVITALTPGEAVIPRSTAQQHRALLGAMMSGKLRYAANGTEEEYVAYLKQHYADLFPGESNLYVNFEPGKNIYVARQVSGKKDPVLWNYDQFKSWMSSFDLPIAEAPAAPAPVAAPPIAGPAPAMPAPLPPIPAITAPTSTVRADLKGTIESLMSSMQDEMLSAARNLPGWDELKYRQGQVSAAQTQLAAATSPDEQLAAVQKLNSAIKARYDVEMERITALKNAAAGIRDYLTELQTSEMSPLKASQKLAASRGTYETTLAKAQAGDVTAAGQLQGVAKEYLSQARGYYASSQSYTDVYTAVTKGLSDFATQIEGGADAQVAYDEMNASLSQIVDILTQINEQHQVGATIGGIVPAMADGGFVAPAPMAATLYRDNVIPFPQQNVTPRMEAVETKLDAVVDRLERLGTVIQLSTLDQTKTLTQSGVIQPIVSRTASTRQVF